MARFPLRFVGFKETVESTGQDLGDLADSLGARSFFADWHEGLHAREWSVGTGVGFGPVRSTRLTYRAEAGTGEFPASLVSRFDLGLNLSFTGSSRRAVFFSVRLLEATLIQSSFASPSYGTLVAAPPVSTCGPTDRRLRSLLDPAPPTGQTKRK